MKNVVLEWVDYHFVELLTVGVLNVIYFMYFLLLPFVCLYLVLFWVNWYH